MLMAAAALNKPCMLLTAGSMLPYEADEGTYVTPYQIGRASCRERV